MDRWHLADPIAWQREARITIQQIAWKDGLVETRDDWSTVHGDLLVRADSQRTATHAARPEGADGQSPEGVSAFQPHDKGSQALFTSRRIKLQSAST
jgi:hypothetical protein